MTGREQGRPERVQTAEELIAVDPSRMTMGMAQVLLLLEERDRLREALEARSEAAVMEILRTHIHGCREWVASKRDKCWAPAEFVLWGKLIPPEGLGPRCYDHAAGHVGHHALAPGSNFALINLAVIARDLAVPKVAG